MKANASYLDRALRFALASLLFAAAQWGAIPVAVIYTLYAASAILAVTAAVGLCPLYRMLGVASRKKQPE